MGGYVICKVSVLSTHAGTVIWVELARHPLLTVHPGQRSLQMVWHNVGLFIFNFVTHTNSIRTIILDASRGMVLNLRLDI